MINAVIEAYRLKDEVRTGWEMRGVRGPESVADHSWGTSLLVMLYADEAGVDRARSLEIATVHDLAEAVTGDVATRVARIDDPDVALAKRRREEAAMNTLLAGYRPDAAERVGSAWEEYEARATPEALFVRDMNLIDMCLQACIYEAGRRYDPDAPNEAFADDTGLDEFFATSAPRLHSQLARRLFDEALDRYAALPTVAGRADRLRREVIS